MKFSIRSAAKYLLVASVIITCAPLYAAAGGNSGSAPAIPGLEVEQTVLSGPFDCLGGTPIDVDGNPASDDTGKIGVSKAYRHCYTWGFSVRNGASGKLADSALNNVVVLNPPSTGFSYTGFEVNVSDRKGSALDPATVEAVCKAWLGVDSDGRSFLGVTLGAGQDFESGWSCLILVDLETQGPDDNGLFFPTTCVALTDDQGHLLRSAGTNEVLFEWPMLHGGAEFYSVAGQLGEVVAAVHLEPVGCVAPLDTDGDGIPDFLDTDDDNDGWTDANEIALGSDPKDPNSTPVTVTDAIYADATSGDDSNGGTKASPVQTVSHAIQLASQQQLDVVLAAGLYSESATLQLADGVSVYGGFTAGAYAPDPNGLSVIEVDSPIGALAEDLTANTEVLQVRIVSADATSGSSYGLFVRSSSGLVFGAGEIAAGAGAPGASGSMGAPGTAGAAGTSGQNGVENSDGLLCASNPQPIPGSGGTAHWSGGAGGWPGLGGQSGFSGQNGAGPGGGSGGSGGAFKSAGTAGTPGLAGSAGSNGATADGEFTADGYVTNYGASGQPGQDGAGGGGGGGGGGGDNLCDSYGGAGGGGGGGGAAGLGGAGGYAGGGSFAVYLWDSDVTILDSTLFTSSGGHGGSGGAGGHGGYGGTGGLGGAGEDDSGAGGRGGAGGNGGLGGQGGSGRGGPSIGILKNDASTLSAGGNAYSLGSAGPGGSPDFLSGIVAETHEP